MDLLPLKLVTEVLVRTARQLKLEDAAAEAKALIFQSYRDPISHSLSPSIQKTFVFPGCRSMVVDQSHV